MSTFSRQSFARIALAGGVMALLAVLIALASSPGPQVQAQEASQAIIKVPDDHATIQAAIGAAGGGDVIQIAQGTYTENLIINKSITIEGGWRSDWLAWDPDLYTTTVDGGGAESVIRIVGSSAPTVDGFEIVNGNAWSGGGIYCAENASLTLRNSDIHHNQATADGGGGVYLDQSSQATLLNNRIHHNQGEDYGGGFYAWYTGEVIVQSNEFYLNQSTNRGGGIYIDTCNRVIVDRNEIYSNSARYLGGGGYFYAYGTGAITISHNLIQGNDATISTAGGGGGLRLVGYARAVISGNIVYSNTARSAAGGLALSDVASLTLINNIIARNTASNRGSGMSLYGESFLPLQGVLTNNTLAENAGGSGQGIHIQTEYAAITLTNNIIVSHTVGVTVEAGATVWANYTLWHGNGTDVGGPGTWTNAHPVYGDPCFVDPAGGDYHILAGSAARDTGDPVGVPPAPSTDIDGDTRPLGLHVDIGADECLIVYDHYLFLPLVLKN